MIKRYSDHASLLPISCVRFIIVALYRCGLAVSVYVVSIYYDCEIIVVPIEREGCNHPTFWSWSRGANQANQNINQRIQTIFDE